MRTIRWIALALIASWAVAADNALDKTDLDANVSACVDFNQYANGGWLKKNPIPPAYSNWGVSNVLAEQNREMLHKILENAAKSNSKVGDYYTSCMDEAVVEKQGLKPLQPELERIAAIKNVADMQAEIAHLANAPLTNMPEFVAA